jgi:O-antigen/teichoic acid export membrane protein
MRTFLSNILSLMAGNVFTLFVNLVFSLSLIAKLTDSEYGLQGAIVSFANIVMAAAYLGLFNLTSRELTNRTLEQQHDIYNTIFSLDLLLAVIASGVACIVAGALNTFPGPQFVIMLLGMFTLVLSYAPIAPTEAFLIVRGQTWRMALLQSFYALCTCVTGIVILFARDNSGTVRLSSSIHNFTALITVTDYGSIYAIYVSLSLLSVLTIGMYMREAHRLVPGGPKLVFRPRQWIAYIREAAPGGLGASLTMLTRSIGTYLVFTFVSNTGAGYIYLSYTLYQAITLIVWVPYAVSILPIMTHLYAESQEKLKWLNSRSITWLLAITLPIALGTMLLTTNILTLLGPSKANAAPTLKIFIWSVPLTVLVEYFFRLQLVSARQHTYIIASALGAFTNILVCFLLVPTYGAPGAALGTVLGMATSTILSGWELREWVISNVRYMDLLTLAIALIGMTIVVTVTGSLSVFLRIFLGGFAYTVLATGLGLFRLSDWRIVRSLLGGAVAPASLTP